MDPGGNVAVELGPGNHPERTDLHQGNAPGGVFALERADRDPQLGSGLSDCQEVAHRSPCWAGGSGFARQGFAGHKSPESCSHQLR